MAHLPAPISQDSLSPQEERLQEAVVEGIARGLRPAEIARKLAGPDKAKAKELRTRIWKLVRRDASFHARVAERAHGEMVLGLVQATQALVSRAGRGRSDAVKLLFEASGFHNPRVKHEHSGDIRVKVELPRPKAVDGQAEELD